MAISCKICFGSHASITEKDRCILDHRDSVEVDGVVMNRANNVFSCPDECCLFTSISGYEICEHWKSEHQLTGPLTSDVLALSQSYGSLPEPRLTRESIEEDSQSSTCDDNKNIIVIEVDTLECGSFIDRTCRAYGFNNRNRLFVCFLCQSGQRNLKSLARHISNANSFKEQEGVLFHPLLTDLSKDELARLRDLDKRCQPTIFKEVNSHLYEVVEGLEVKAGYYYCRSCKSCFKSKKTYDNHNCDTTQRETEIVNVQSLFKKPVRFFPVKIHAENSFDGYDVCKEQLSDEIQLFKRRRLENVSDSIQAKLNHWDEDIPFVERKMIYERLKNMEFSSSIKKVVEEFFEEVNQSITTAPPYILRKITAADMFDEQYQDLEIFDLVPKGQKAFRSIQEQSLKKYGNYGYDLLCFCLLLDDAERSLIAAVNDFMRCPSVSSLLNVFVEVFQKEYDLITPNKSKLIYRFMVVSNVNADILFKPATLITPKIAMLRFLCRGVFLLKVMRENVSEDMFHKEIAPFLSTFRNTPYNCIGEQMAKLSSIASEEQMVGRLVWLDSTSFLQLRFDDITVSMENLKSASNSLIKRCHNIAQQLLQGFDFPDWFSKKNGIIDILGCSTSYYSFLIDPRNRFDTLLPLVLEYFMSNTQKRSCLVQIDVNKKSYIWIEHLIESWCLKCCYFINLLLTLVHLTAGMPSRGTEIAQMRYCNIGSFERNVYWYNDRILLFLRDHKMKWKEGLAQNAKFLSVEVSQLMLIYLSTLRPVFDFFFDQVLKKQVSNGWLWVNMHSNIDGESIRDEVSNILGTELNTKLTFAAYRHIAQAFSERHMTKSLDADIEMINLQFGHKSATGFRNYANSDADSVVRRDILIEGLRISKKWQSLLGLEKKMEPLDNLSVNCRDSKNESPVPVIHQITNYHYINTSSQNGINSSYLALQIEKIEPLIKKALFVMDSKFGFKEFRSEEQCRAVTVALQRETDLLFVCPTGYGKSMVIFLPALIEEQLGLSTIVIVPFVELGNQIVSKCRELGISAAKWSSTMSDTEVYGVQVVSIETANSPDFVRYLKILHSNRINNLKRCQLARIIIDEVHVLASDSFFRKQAIKDIELFRCVPEQLILMSATVPPSSEELLNKKFCSNFHIIRKSCSVSQQSYAVEKVETYEQGLNRLKTILQTKCKTVVFVMTRSLAQSLVLEISGAMSITSETPEEEKLASWSEFNIRDDSIMVATSCLSAGVDMVRVGRIIHMDGSYSLMDYIQETGRGGRGLSRCECLLIHWNSQQNSQDIEDYIANDLVCRRAFLTAKMDGYPTFCYQSLDNQKCDICRSSGQIMLKSSEIATTKVSNGSTASTFNPSMHAQKTTFNAFGQSNLPEASRFIKDVNKESFTVGCDVLPAKMNVASYSNEITNSAQRPCFQSDMRINSANGQSGCVGDRFSVNSFVSAAVNNQQMLDASNVIAEFKDKLDLVALYGCVLCNFVSNAKLNHGEIVQCPIVKHCNACVKCLLGFGSNIRPDHSGSSCKYRFIANSCYKCGLPSKASSIQLHKRNEGFKYPCSYGDILLPLSWVIWRSPEHLAVLGRELNIDFQHQSFNEDNYFKWMMDTSSFFGIPNIGRVLTVAVKFNWIQLHKSA